MKTCPFCAEEIQDAAIVCKHCRRDLAPLPATASSALKVCFYCAEQIHKSAVLCKHCGANVAVEPAKPLYTGQAVRPPASPMTVTDISIPFWSMVALLLQLAVAAIPALVILGIAAAFIAAILTGIGLSGLS